MIDADIKNRVAEALDSFERRAIANGRTFAQEVEGLLEVHRKFTPEERVAVSAYFRSEHPQLQPSLSLDEIREGLM